MPFTFQERKLASGLTVIAETDPSAHTASCGFFVRTGARDESTSIMGVSHFLEHMMFKGTGDLSAEALNQAFDNLGARNNAYTSSEMTCFYAHCLPEHLGTITDLLARMMRPALREEDFKTEKGVILEEIAMYKDNPFWVLYEATLEKHYGEHPIAHRVLGTTETISALERNQMEEYFNTRYSADNTVVAFAGRLDFDKACQDVERRCANWAATRATRSAVRPVPGSGRLELRDAKVSRAYMLGMCEGPAFEDDRRYAAALLAQILGAPDNSRLHWALVEPGLADEAAASHDAHDGIGEYYVYISCDPDRSDEAWTEVEKQLDGLIESVTADDLERLRNKFATAATLGGERPNDRMQRLGRLWTYTARYRSLEQELDRINAVTLDDLRDVYRAFPLRPATVGRMLPAR